MRIVRSSELPRAPEIEDEVRSVIAALCSRACNGRRSGTAGGAFARRVVKEALRAAGLDPWEQPVPGCGGANVLAKIEGDAPGYVVVGAHFDHLGSEGANVFWGADDNAAAVAALVRCARELRGDRAGRGVLFAAFDGEEPPFFGTSGMGSRAFLEDPPVPASSIEFMVCMDLVGHGLGPAHAPPDVAKSIFALGAELSEGTPSLLQALSRAERGVVVRRMEASVIRPMSDYEPFWRAHIPFLFLTAGRGRNYHTPEDTPDRIDYPKTAAVARWLVQWVRAVRRRESASRFNANGSDAMGTLSELHELTAPFAPTANLERVRAGIQALRAQCNAGGELPQAMRGQLERLVAGIEASLAGS